MILNSSGKTMKADMGGGGLRFFSAEKVVFNKYLLFCTFIQAPNLKNMDPVFDQRLLFAIDVRFELDQLTIELANGEELSYPLAWFPNLYDASPIQLTKYHITANGRVIRWPELGVDISVKELLHPQSIAC